ncbi:hypothetical protein AMS68_005661 [Peltaster fructicola]|uniref:Uncharacterized protein n=1 Tax=Peltaster fructicola TaxID=286661 RepID=A0A6H0XZF7_9PEZI|nr:hypothetical protein AMS68_005661 [Peltaster fructicola]
MAVVNDLLKSPHISAHLSQRGSDFKIPYGRPRSRTAPSTPRYELPLMEPFELPGSIPIAGRQSLNAFAPPRNNTTPAAFGQAVERHRSSPYSVAEGFTVPSRTSMDSGPGSVRPDVRTYSHSSMPAISNGSHEGSESSRAPSFTAIPSRPPLTVLQPSSLKYDVQSDDGTTQDSTVRHDSLRDDVETTLMQQIAMMRSSHDTHVKSLKHAHDQEIASHLAYIAFLERRQSSKTDSCSTNQPLTIDTSPSPAPSELPGLDVSTTTLQSSDTSLDGRTSTSQETLTEVESLRRKLSLVRKEQAESTDLAQQRAQLRESLEQKDRRILQLKELAKRAKENEKTLRNTVSDLEARLVAANNQRLDVLEGFNAVSSTLEAISKQKSPLIQVLPNHIAASEAPATTKTYSRAAGPQTPADDSALLAQVRTLESTLKEKEDQINHLVQQAQSKSSSDNHNAERFVELQTRLDEGLQAVRDATKDRDRYHSLLQGELRRNARHAARTYPISPAIAAEAVSKANDLLANAKATALNDANTDEPLSVPALLEKELQHCLGEIIMYKLDVRGYRKDLKDAKAQLENVYASNAQRPMTPPRSVSRNRAQRGTDSRSHRQGGLGIMMSSNAPATPPRSIASTTADSLFAPSDTVSNVSTPNHRPMTPMVGRKRLSKPSSSQHSSPHPTTAQSPPTLKLSRAETMQSMSESIVLSYTSPELLEAGVFDYSRQGHTSGRDRSPSLVNIERKLVSLS